MSIFTEGRRTELKILSEGWKKTAHGYELQTRKGLAKVFKKGKTWFVQLGDKEVDLGKRASFDHAEGALHRMGAL